MKVQLKRGRHESKRTVGSRSAKSARPPASKRQERGNKRARPIATPAKAKTARSSKPGLRKRKLPVPAKKPKKALAVRSVPAAPPRSAVPPPAQSMAPGRQQQLYEEAVRLFQSQKFERANALFQKAMGGGDRALAHRAQVHSRVCQSRLQPAQVDLKTADDHYNYAVTLMNARNLGEAAQHLETALQMAPRADHVHYAMAATQALQGNLQAAYEKLKTAIELQPRNRVLARSDPDFVGILEYPPLASLLHVERWGFPKAP